MSLLRALRYADKRYRKDGAAYDKADIQHDLFCLEMALLELM